MDLPLHLKTIMRNIQLKIRLNRVQPIPFGCSLNIAALSIPYIVRTEPIVTHVEIQYVANPSCI